MIALWWKGEGRFSSRFLIVIPVQTILLVYGTCSRLHVYTIYIYTYCMPLVLDSLFCSRRKVLHNAVLLHSYLCGVWPKEMLKAQRCVPRSEYRRFPLPKEPSKVFTSAQLLVWWSKSNFKSSTITDITISWYHNFPRWFEIWSH